MLGRTVSHSGLPIGEAQQSPGAGLGGMGAQERGPVDKQTAPQRSRAMGLGEGGDTP